MELVYLWVEEYKNIEKQGFNFSPKFKCEYDEERNELTIDENKEHISIFPDNINITAIVGENGAGKSTLLISILGLLFNNGNEPKYSNWREFKRMILVFNNKEKNIVYTFSGQQNSKKEFTTFPISNQEWFNLYANMDSCILNEELKSNYYLLLDFSLGQQDIWNDSKDYKVDYALEPSRIYRSTGGAGITSKIEPASFDSTMKSNAIFFYHYIFEYKLDSFLEEFNLPVFKYLEYIKASQKGMKIKEQSFKEMKMLSTFDIKFNTLNTWKEVNDVIKDNFINPKHIVNDITQDSLFDLDKLFIYSDIEMRTEENQYFYELSTGQQLLISYLGIIIRTHLRIKDVKDIFNILIDEIETSLHPAWQKRFLIFIIKFITESKIIDNYSSVNLITSTHSPFILSDLPKENVIFLEKGKQVDPAIETFGANIHTLLSHGFFMKDGLMGEFAKEKINEVINFLNDSESTIKSNEEAQDLINIIGEPVIRKQLQKMLDSKRLSKIDEIDLIKNQIQALSNKLKEIENAED